MLKSNINKLIALIAKKLPVGLTVLKTLSINCTNILGMTDRSAVGGIAALTVKGQNELTSFHTSMKKTDSGFHILLFTQLRATVSCV